MSKKKKSGKKTALKVIGIILAVVVVFVGVYAALMAWTPAATTYSGEINPYITADAALVSAHRSGGGIMPENTMLAFESCMNSKDFNTDIFEFDLHITRITSLSSCTTIRLTEPPTQSNISAMRMSSPLTIHMPSCAS